MSKLKNKINKNLLRIYIALLFILVYGLIIYLFPHQQKFEYEFQQGSPWMHEDLFAEYSFPVYKTDAEITAEKDSILVAFTPYYKKDSLLVKKSKSQFKSHFNNKWNQFWTPVRVSKLNLGQSQLGMSVKKLRDSLYSSYLRDISKVYKTGVLPASDTLINQNESFHMLDDGFSRPVDKSNYYSLEKAFTMPGKSFTYRPKSRHPELDSMINQFMATISPEEFIRANIVKDKVTNQKILDEELSDISLTRGMVQKGELIILKGHKVDKKAYKRLLSLKKEYESGNDESNAYMILGGTSILILAAALILFLFLYHFKPKILHSLRKSTFVLLQVLILMLITIFLKRYTDISIYIIPYVLVPMIMSNFFDSRIALFLHLSVILMAGFFAPNGFEFVFIQMIAGIVAVFSLKEIQRRKQIFTTAFYVLLVYIALFFGMQIYYTGGIEGIQWLDLAWLGGNGLLLLFVLPMIYAYEKIFGFVSDVTLMELSDTNHPLLRQLAEKAPGTFQHSLQVANLAESVSREIGGNRLLVHTGALYHDIGKAADPQYFIENQAGANPHENIEFDESAKIIIGHVKKGVKMAHKNKLPEQIIDFIRTHHGTGLTRYFYNSYANKYPDRDITEADFSYPGPTPRNVENAILMMADAVEAATRSLKEYTADSIRNMVEKVIDGQVAAGQFEDINLTFRDISTAKRVFTDKLKSIYHVRIEYPELNKNKTKAGQGNKN